MRGRASTQVQRARLINARGLDRYELAQFGIYVHETLKGSSGRATSPAGPCPP